MTRPATFGAIAKVSTRTRLSETTEAIRRLVLDGVVTTGSRLKEQELAEALGVSRPTVREAVRQLVHEGILVHEPYKGLRVATVDDEHYSQLAEVRAALEVVGAQRVAARLTPEIDGQIMAALEDVRRADSVAAFNEAHFAFHALLQKLAGADILEQAWGLVENRSRMMLRIDLEIDPTADRMTPHIELIEAIRSRDEDVIAAAVREHVIGSARVRIAHRQALAGAGVEPALAWSTRGRRGRPSQRAQGA